MRLASSSKQNCRAAPYWLDTSSNDLITEIVSLGLAFRGKKAVLCKR